DKDPGRFNLVVASDVALSEKESAGLSLNAKPFAMTQARALVQAAKADMQPGDSYQFANLMYTTNLEGDEQHIDVYRAGDSTTYIVNDGGKFAAAGIKRSTVIPGTAIEAGVFYLTADTLTAAAATRLRILGPLLESNMPVNVQLNLATGEAQIQATEQVEVTYVSADGETTEMFEKGTHALELRPIDKPALQAIADTLGAKFQQYASAAAGVEERAVGTGEKLAKLWEYNDFCAYANFATIPEVTLQADRTPMTPDEAGYGVGKPPDLLRTSGNVMFRDGEAVQIDIDLAQPKEIRQIVIKSRQLKTFNGGCGVSKLTVWTSDDKFAEDKRMFGEFENSKELENGMMPYS
ncbi:unnamed protein product, partial [marine sediment metagenome]